jgi:hypothetical protein
MPLLVWIFFVMPMFFLQWANTCPADRKVFFAIDVRCCLQGTDYGIILVKPPGQQDEDEDEGETFCEVSI